jgi:arylsulfatase A-like enzyme/endonuclease/exonuclease/phosphatase family metal-dependent hydrolase
MDSSRLKLVVIAAVLALIASSCLVSRGLSQTGDSLTAMSFNIRYGTARDGDNSWEHRREAVIEVIDTHRPAVLGVQEALRFQLDELGAAMPRYEEIGVGRSDGVEAGEYAAILIDRNRLELLDKGNFWFSDTPEVPGSTSWGNEIPRICTWARLRDRLTGSSFYVYNNHWDHQSQPSRERSAELLMQWIAGRDAGDDSVLVTGDFNAGESNPAFRRLLAAPAAAAGDAREPSPGEALDPGGVGRAGLRLFDTFRALHPGATGVGTFNGFEGRTDGDKIDAVLASEEWEVLRAGIVRDAPGGRYPSDHFPVIAELVPRLPPGEKAGAIDRAALASDAPAVVPAVAPHQPNILFIVADDLNTRIAPYVEPSLELHTPNLDRLAARGMRFSRAYSQYPVCAPSRASFMSGLYPESNGVTDNDFDAGNHRIKTPSLAGHPTLAGFLRERGYFTARVSKIFHMGVPGGIERGEVGSDDPDSWDYAVNIMAPETLTRGTLEKLSRGDHYGSNFSRMILPDGHELTQADVLATNQAIAILENRAGAKPSAAANRTKLKEGAPFFLAVGFVRPHVPLIAPERHFAHYPDEEIELPFVPAGDLDDVPEPARRNGNKIAARFGMSTAEQRQAIAAYYASVSFMDEQLGRLLDTLQRLGLAESTIVIFTSDHGFNLGEHTAWQKTSLWEESVRVPLIISIPGMEHTGARSNALVELIDLYPTVAELAGLGADAPAILQGESLTSLLESPARAGSEGVAYTITSAGGASLRTGRWRYNRWGEKAGGDNEELYDHDRDPEELHNLASDPAHAEILESLRQQLEQMRESSRASRSGR